MRIFKSWPLTWFKPTMPNENHISPPCPFFELVAKGKLCIANVILFTALSFSLSLSFPCMGLRTVMWPRKRRSRVIGNSWNGFTKVLSGISICLRRVCFEFCSAALRSAIYFSQLEKTREHTWAGHSAPWTFKTTKINRIKNSCGRQHLAKLIFGQLIQYLSTWDQDMFPKTFFLASICQVVHKKQGFNTMYPHFKNEWRG